MHMYFCSGVAAAANGALSAGSVKLVVVAVALGRQVDQPRARAQRVVDDEQAQRRRHPLGARFDGPQQRRQQRGRAAGRSAETIAS